MQTLTDTVAAIGPGRGLCGDREDAAVFKRYSQAKLSMMREALYKLDLQANERRATSFTALAG